MMLPKQEAAAAQPFSRGSPPACRVPGCAADMAGEKTYAQRKRLCAQHMQEYAVLLGDGANHRFCFSCGKMHPLECFDGKHRNCRAALLKRRQQGSGGSKRNASPALAPELDAAHALATQPSALELPLGLSHGVPPTWQLLPPAVSVSGNGRRRSSNGSSSSVVPVPAASDSSWPQLASALAAPALDEESALELMLEAELAAAGLHALLAASTGASSTSSSAPSHDGRRRELSWQLASAVVENSLSQPNSVSADLCLLQHGPLDISAGYGMSLSSGPLAAAAPGSSNAAAPACALGAPTHSAPPQLAATAAAGTPGSVAGDAAEQMARLGHLQAQMAALQSQVAMMQARAHSLRQRLAMCPA